jgi:acetyl/propionyl-CoA carboxylase alpha subunit/acetyl-CoA carboxylase carboxyltransferase component
MFSRVLIANRGEIAIRIARALRDLGIVSVAIYPKDDKQSLHVRAASESTLIPGKGAAAYLDIAAVVAAAHHAGCEAIHPGYGFLSENADFAAACHGAGIAFIGPSPEALRVFGDKANARALAKAAGVPIIVGTDGACDLDQVKAFFAGLPSGSAMMLKAIAGGGGRGVRIIRDKSEIEAGFAACTREARAAFGNGGVYAERLLQKARHIEVQIAGDGDDVIALGERDCSVQRRHQKIIEIAPAPSLSDHVRKDIHLAATRIGRAAHYRNVGTVEFLLDATTGEFAFIESNARLQVEHTITEEVTGLDLVRLQIQLAAARTLTQLGLVRTPPANGYAVEARVNLEKMASNGSIVPTGGRITAYEPPSGPGVRVDGYGYAGYVTSPNYDSLLAKVIARGPTLAAACARLERALMEFRIDGVQTNITLLRAILGREVLAQGKVTTRFVETSSADLLAKANALPGWSFDPDASTAQHRSMEVVEGATAVKAPLQATVGPVDVKIGDLVRKGQQLLILEAMKMEHAIDAPTSGRVVRLNAATGDVVMADQPLAFIVPEEVGEDDDAGVQAIDLDRIRPDLAEVNERWRLTLDEARPEAIAARRKHNQRTARENIIDLIDPGTFIEYGAFTIGNQRYRFSEEQLKKMSPADGMISGIGSVNGALFPPERAATIACAYDYTVFAGTQATMNHMKTDRILQVAYEQKLPIVFFAEGGGGRPGESLGRVSRPHTWGSYAMLSGVVPTIAVVSRYCFAGNASIAGMSEILIATENSNIGMAGPAMIEGGGMGVVKPTEIGPIEVQRANGVVDVVAADEIEATRLAKQALSYFQGRLTDWSCADQRLLRSAIPENRLRAYDVRPIIANLADTCSVLELRRDFAPGMITAFIRIEGRPMGVICNDSRYLGGAIDSDCADKASRFMQLCDAFNIPILSLIDTSGFMVGVESEARAAVRKTSRMFIAGRKLGVPLFSVVLRKCYGLGASAMIQGSKDEPVFSLSWPTGEFGTMGLEGAVRLAFRKEIEAEVDPTRQKAVFDEQVAKLYAAGKAIEHATMLRIDAVIDPADTRRWLVQGLNASAPRRQHAPPRNYVDTW